MKLPTLDGWLKWSFNDNLYGLRSDKNCKYKFIVEPHSVNNFYSYKDALFFNASAARDYYTGQFDVLFSGGIDSEIVIRTFKDLGIKHNTFIFRYNRGYNRKEVEYAIETATCLNIDYKIIDFNLEAFFENDAYDLFLRSRCIRAGRLVHLKLCELMDNIPVMGDAEPYWFRELGKDYSKKSKWTFPLNESNHNCSIYMHSLGRENLCDFYEFTPGLIKYFNYHPTIQKLLNDELVGKLSNWTSRIPIHREIWPDIKSKHKLTGYEGENFTGVYSEFMTKFQQRMTDEIGNGDEYWLTLDKVDTIFY